MTAANENYNDHQRFRTDLPFFVNGTLSLQDQAWMKSYLERFPNAQGALAFEQSLYATLQDPQEDIPYDEKLKRFLDEMPSELLQPLNAWQRIYGFLTQTPPAEAPSPSDLWQQGIRIPTPVFAILATLVVGQVALMVQNTYDESEHYRSQPLAACQKMPAIKIIVKPEAKQSELISLLRKADLSIVAGPSEIGELWLAVTGDRQTQQTKALAQLRNSALINEAILLPIAPCKP